MITGIRFATIYVRDQDQALEFWTNAMGGTVQLDTPMSDDPGAARWIEVALPGDTYLVLYDVTQGFEGADREGPSNLWFQSDDLDPTFAELSARGVPFTVEPQQAPWDPSQRWAQFRDPDGHLFGLS
jgi:catechol 2,3-dioxygenase-like lactoylglutathione lyase family enzyme